MYDTMARATRTFLEPPVINPLGKPVKLGSTVVNLDDVLHGDVLTDGNFYFPVVQPDESVIMCVLPVGELGVEIVTKNPDEDLLPLYLDAEKEVRKEFSEQGKTFDGNFDGFVKEVKENVDRIFQK